MRYFLLSLFSILVIACQEDDKKLESDPFFSDSTFRQIVEYQEERQAKSLVKFLKHINPIYRSYAAEALGSVQDTAVIEDVFAALLAEENASVRRSLVYALGQTNDSTAAQKLLFVLEQEKDTVVRKEILESIGKCIDQENISELNLFKPQNKPEKIGFSWGLYRAAIRSVVDPVSVQAAVSLLPAENPYSARLAASHLLARARDIDIEPHMEEIILAAELETTPQVRMQVVSALGKLAGNEAAFKTLLKRSSDVDYRVRVEAYRAMAKWGDVKASFLVKGLSDQHFQVSTATAESLGSISTELLMELSDSLDLNSLYWRSRRIFETRLLEDPANMGLIDSLKSEYDSIDNPYEKAMVLSALKVDISSWEFVVTSTFKADHNLVALSGFETLKAYTNLEDFPQELQPDFDQLMINAVASENVPLINSALAKISGDSSYGFKQRVSEIDFLYEARDWAIKNEELAVESTISKSIAYMEDAEYTENPQILHKPIEWSKLQDLEGEIHARIITSEGTIDINLFYSDAPATVASFLSLIDSEHYKGVEFHRVVPNFVAQCGAFSEGNWASKEYTIRSELGPRRYTTGSVGMASSGKDTEGSQFFITHSPTPHLDGRYTIFAEVVSGMEVVEELHMGSEILDIMLLEGDSTFSEPNQ